MKFKNRKWNTLIMTLRVSIFLTVLFLQPGITFSIIALIFMQNRTLIFQIILMFREYEILNQSKFSWSSFSVLVNLPRFQNNSFLPFPCSVLLWQKCHEHGYSELLSSRNRGIHETFTPVLKMLHCENEYITNTAMSYITVFPETNKAILLS